MAVSISLNLLVVVFGVFLIFTAGSKAYSFGHNIFDEQAIASDLWKRARGAERCLVETPLVISIPATESSSGCVTRVSTTVDEAPG